MIYFSVLGAWDKTRDVRRCHTISPGFIATNRIRAYKAGTWRFGLQQNVVT